MENEIFERDYRGTENKETLSPNQQKIWEYAVESGIFKAYDEAKRKIPKYIVQKDKETYEHLIFFLDIYAKRKHGKIKGIVDYDKYECHIYVDLPFFEACTPEDLTLLSYMGVRTHNVTFQASENGGIRLSIRINYFDEIEDTKNVFTDCIMKDEKLVEMLMEEHEKEKEQILSDPELSEYTENENKIKDMSPDEFYGLLEDFSEEVFKVLSDDLSDENKEKDSE